MTGDLTTPEEAGASTAPTASAIVVDATPAAVSAALAWLESLPAPTPEPQSRPRRRRRARAARGQP